LVSYSVRGEELERLSPRVVEVLKMWGSRGAPELPQADATPRSDEGE